MKRRNLQKKVSRNVIELLRREWDLGKKEISQDQELKKNRKAKKTEKRKG
jgi:hypothetical protein